MQKYDLIWYTTLIAFLLPFFNFVFANIMKGILDRKIILYTCTISLISAALLFYISFYNLEQYLNEISKSRVVFFLWHWINISYELNVNMTINLDILSGVMGCIVLSISALVHLYSLGYMSDDKQQEKFMSYLSLFTFFMLILIFSDNLLQLFIGWEGVGLCSYLLIGFWYNKKSANKAAIKAFVVNRVADVGLIVAMGLILSSFNSLDFYTILDINNIDKVEQNMIDLICISMLIGCMGKSAQIFLHVWLPDAMEGPTPVSALIHAATMVTAGIFLVVRCSPLFEQSMIARDIMTIIGAVTAIFAATIALVQTDIKRIIAYSTCSQLGYMFFACGISAYDTAIFHLATHAFFKALLFLGAGSIIHSVDGEQDIHKMGGLRKRLPITHILMWIGSLALAGIYPFAGYYSKHAIINSAYFNHSHYGEFAYYAGLFTGLLTAFYSWRLIILVFNGKQKSYVDVHESGLLMLVPLGILAIGALFSGIMGQKLGVIGGNFWHNSLCSKEEFYHHNSSLLVESLPTILAFTGIILAYIIYYLKIAEKFKLYFKPLHRLLLNAYFFDCIYQIIFIIPIKTLGRGLWLLFDNKLIDGIPGLCTRVIKYLGCLLTCIHNGNIQNYAIIFFSFIAISFYQLLSDMVFSEFWIIALIAICGYFMMQNLVNRMKI